tara:strand:+ start:303 stop:704 length:402 start_codon:yes stop_codon:yes gene_type:complete
MLGGGNPVGGGSPASTGNNLNYLGNHVYANSGIINVNNTDTPMLTFTSGAGYIVAKVQTNNASGSNDDIKYFIKFNGETIATWYFSTAGNHNDPMNPVYVIIPAETKVEIRAQNQQSSSDRENSAILTGRVYY